MAASMYNMFVGSEIGLLKGINATKSYWHNLNQVKEADKAKELCCMSWKDESETELLIGLKNKQILSYNLTRKSFLQPLTLDGGNGNLRNVCQHEDTYVTALDSGMVNVWRDIETVCDFKTGDNLYRMTQNPYEKHVIGTGGKETDLKIWDLNDVEKPIFTAKNVRNDRMELRVPVWIMGIGFLQNDKIVTSSGHHHIRVYDPKTQRRPILTMTFDEYPLTALSVRSENQVVVGNTQGKMALVDLRNKGKLVHTFKGFAGAIRSIHCHPTKPLAASCGLDRFLRIHNLDTKTLDYKFYLKSRLNCVLFKSDWKESDELNSSGNEDLVEVKSEPLDSDDDDGNDNDDIWDDMEVVKTRTVKKGAVQKEDKPVKRKKVQDTQLKKRKKKKV